MFFLYFNFRFRCRSSAKSFWF